MTLARGLRSGNLFSKRDTAVLDAPELSRAPAQAPRRRGAPVTEMPRRVPGYAEDYGDSFEPESEFAERSRKPGVRLSFNGGLMPKSRWGRIVAASGFIVLAGLGVAGLMAVRSFLLRDEHFVVESSSAIQIEGNSHLTRPQLLSVFGEDVERNIFNMPLVERRSELESLPWVAHATVMRLLPNRVRVAIVERTPVAFVRQGKEIELVDAHGVLLDMGRPLGADGTLVGKDYSFPVLTGISAAEPLSTRAARMKIYLEFVAALDAAGEKISLELSEVDVSNPEDVKAILPGGNAGGDILVHFGDAKFLERYHQYVQHLAEWKTQYPKLASVDMRYERQVVLEMQPGSAVPNGTPAAAPVSKVTDLKPVAKAAVAAKPDTSTAAKGKTPAIVHPAMKTPAVAGSRAATAVGAAAVPVTHLTTAFDVGSAAVKPPATATRSLNKAPVPTPAVQGAPR